MNYFSRLISWVPAIAVVAWRYTHMSILGLGCCAVGATAATLQKKKKKKKMMMMMMRAMQSRVLTCGRQWPQPNVNTVR